MKTQNEANRYDRIFIGKRGGRDHGPRREGAGHPGGAQRKGAPDVQRTLERKPDQLLRITDTAGQVFLLHLEFQLADEPGMVDRMHEYRALLRRRHTLPVRQYVVFLSSETPRMATRIEEDNLSFAYHLIQMAQVDYRLFLDSPRADEVVFAILGHFGADSPQQAARHIVQRVAETSGTPPEKDKYLEQLRILASLRKLNPYIEQIMESILKYINPEDDYLYQKGMEKGVEWGIEKGAEQEAERLRREVIGKLLKDGTLSVKQIAMYFEVSEEYVAHLRDEGSS